MRCWYKTIDQMLKSDVWITEEVMKEYRREWKKGEGESYVEELVCDLIDDDSPTRKEYRDINSALFRESADENMKLKVLNSRFNYHLNAGHYDHECCG